MVVILLMENLYMCWRRVHKNTIISVVGQKKTAYQNCGKRKYLPTQMKHPSICKLYTVDSNAIIKSRHLFSAASY